MKQENRFIQFLFTRSLSLKLIFLGLNCQALTTVNINKTDNITPDIEKLVFHTPVYSINNQPENLSDTMNYLVILKNKKCCDDCFIDINAFIKAAKSQLHAEYVVVSLVDSNTLARKKSMARNKLLMPDLDKYYFQYTEPESETLFNVLGTVYSPEILLINRGKVTRIPYSKIFQPYNNDIEFDVQQEIFNILK